jgi:hypothetical protein
MRLTARPRHEDGNSYLFLSQNPATLSDPFGLFSAQHHEGITRATLAMMRWRQVYVDEAVRGNLYVDRLDNQTNNHQHSIRHVTEDVNDARMRADRFTVSQIHKAVRAVKCQKDVMKGAFEFGQALHTEQDRSAHDFITLPQHALPRYVRGDLAPSLGALTEAEYMSVHWAVVFHVWLGADAARYVGGSVP